MQTNVQYFSVTVIFAVVYGIRQFMFLIAIVMRSLYGVLARVFVQRVNT